MNFFHTYRKYVAVVLSLLIIYLLLKGYLLSCQSTTTDLDVTHIEPTFNEQVCEFTTGAFGMLY